MHSHAHTSADPTSRASAHRTSETGNASFSDQRPAQQKATQLQAVIQQKQLAAQLKPEDELPKQKKEDPAQRAKEEDKLKQAKFAAQLKKEDEKLPSQRKVIQRQENKTGMPDQLKSGIENLSGMDMSDVRVHYNSAQPAQLNALAYAQGTDIHVASGQEQHLAHEAWHVVQQKQGRVQPTMEVAGTPVNDNVSLEKEADTMGAKAMQFKATASNQSEG